MSLDTIKVLMPLMGEGVNEATLVRWLKKPGEAVSKDEPLFEVSTDKVDTEIPSPAAGVLNATNFKDGDTVKVNAVLALISTANGKASTPDISKNSREVGKGTKEEIKSVPKNISIVQVRENTTNPPSNIRSLRSSPLVRKMARDQGVDLNMLQGSGNHGRITKQDFLEYLQNPAKRTAQLPTETKNTTSGETRDALELTSSLFRVKTSLENGLELLEGVAVRREKMSHMRKRIAEHMIRSVRTSPHVTTTFEIDLHRVVNYRETNKNSFLSREGFNLTYTAFFVYTAVQAIKKFPIVNCSVDGDEILYKNDINIGVAVAIETGLIVPVIKKAQDLNLTGIARSLNDLAKRARTKALVPDEVRGGTFSITNPGLYGSIHSSPIINQPQVAMLSVGAIVKRPVVIDDMIAVRPLCMVGLTFDHRVIDGEGGAKYLAFYKEFMEAGNFEA
ncbi:MAG: 2-oxo acid dehydrogenase subunit E2 [Oligoflexales bacterium]|nr:2-oxo acid dehydrogenase subunit E2 [Oligoflexales bacterium]